MSQKDFLRDMDARLHAGFVGAGLADAGQYTAPGGGAAVPARVYVDRDVLVRGEFGQVVGKRTEVAYLLEDCSPERSGQLVVDGDIFVNVDQVDTSDSSLSRWVVRHA
jgi:hypothetical protein